MCRIRSDRFVLAFLTIGLLPAGLAAQSATASGAVRSSEISISRENAELHLELADGRVLEYAVRNGTVFVDGKKAGSAARGSELDLAWRELLNRAMDTPADQLGSLLTDWDPPAGSAGTRLDAALSQAIASVPATALNAAPADAQADADPRLERQMDELRAEVERLREDRERLQEQVAEMRKNRDRAREDRSFASNAVGHIVRQIKEVFEWLFIYGLLVALGFGVVFFGRNYLEGVADTARQAPMRSGLVGVAAAFLAIPAFVLGCLALVVSIVGIPALLVWVPLFPVALVLSAVFGYIAVAHAAGEALAERRLHASDWFNRANSYYFVATGLGLLIMGFIAKNLISIFGIPVIPGLIGVITGFISWVAVSIGLGAILISRGGTRPLGRPLQPDLGDVFEEESHV